MARGRANRNQRQAKPKKKARRQQEESYANVPVIRKRVRREPSPPEVLPEPVHLEERPTKAQRVHRKLKSDLKREKLQQHLNEYREQFLTARISRALNERMYLLQAEELQEGWLFKVQGSRGIPYRVELGLKRSSCACPDHRNHSYSTGRPCKHIYFIIFRVAGALELQQQLAQQYFLTTKQYESVCQSLKRRLTLRTNPPEFRSVAREHEKSPSLDEDCAICFEQLADINSIKSCFQCHNGFHLSCLKVWMNKNASCPLCRTDLTKLLQPNLVEVNQVGDSPLNKLKRVRMG